MTPAAAGPATALITGASGFVGRHLAEWLVNRGWRVRGLVRALEQPGLRQLGVELFEGDLPDSIDETAFVAADVVVHAAYTSRHTTLEQARRVNEEGTHRVVELSRRHGARKFVFLSTTSAHADALSYYGRSKRALEQRLDLERDLVLRVGLVLGADGGLFRRLTSAIERTGVVPLLDGGRQPVQTIHVDDLCAAIERAVERDLSGRLVVASPEAIPMRELFRGVASRLDRRCVLLPVPIGPLLFGLRAAEWCRLPLPVSSENLLGARAMRYQPSAADLERLGLTLRSVEASLDQLLSGH